MSKTVEGITLVKCIKVGEVNFGEWTNIEPIKTCYMDTQTTIDSKGFSINERPANATFGLLMNYNKDIAFLPENSPEVFPYLLAYAAANCAIEEIYKENFDGLEHLRFLNLAGNKISEISSNTFRSLVSLERLSMVNNQIKTMDGNLFEHTKSLVKVWFKTNQCIDQNLIDEESVAKIVETVDDFCGIVSKRDVKLIMAEVTEQMKTLVEQKTENLLKQIRNELEQLNITKTIKAV